MPAAQSTTPAKPLPSERRKNFGAYLVWLGNRSHLARLKRTPAPVVKPSREPFVRCANTLWPWRTYEYPGRSAILAHILGIGRDTAARYLKPGIRIPTKHKRRLVAYLEARSALFLQLAAALRAELPPDRPPQK